MRALYRVSLLAATAALLLMMIAMVRAGGADAQPRSDRVAVIVLDLHSLAADEATADLARSAIGLLLQLKAGQPFVFAFDDEFADVAGPMATTAEPFPQLLEEVEGRLGAPPPDTPLDLPTTLAGAHEYLNGLSVGDDSSIYILSANAAETDGANEIARVSPLLGIVAEKGWTFYDATAPGTNAGVRAALSEISTRTGGRSFELSVPDGLWEMTAQTLMGEDMGALLRIGETTLAPDAIFGAPLDVPPGTGAVNLVMLRENADATFRLKNPSGDYATDADSGSSAMAEYANAVVWELSDPKPGEWTIEARGSAGKLSVSRYSEYHYRMELVAPTETVEVGRQVTMQVAVIEGDNLVSVNAAVNARVKDPSGATVLYELNDDGVGADSVPDDGYFSATIPGVSLSGDYEVELEMAWEGVSQRVTSLASFEAQLFPTLTLTGEIERDAILKMNERAQIGALQVGVGNQPFAVSKNDLSSAASTNTGAAPGVVEFLPADQTPDGKASEFEVYYTPQSESLSSVTITLRTEYAGREVADSVSPIVVSSVQPPPPAPTPAPRATAAPAPTTPPPPALPSPEEQLSPFPLLILAGVVILVVIGLGAYWLSKPSPFGYLYTEDGRMAVSFADVERSGASSVLSRDRIAGDELPAQGFEGVEFRFGRGGKTFIEPTQVTGVNVRLNNQPVTGLSELFEGSMLGSMGRLYVFRRELQ